MVFQYIKPRWTAQHVNRGVQIKFIFRWINIHREHMPSQIRTIECLFVSFDFICWFWFYLFVSDILRFSSSDYQPHFFHCFCITLYTSFQHAVKYQYNVPKTKTYKELWKHIFDIFSMRYSVKQLIRFQWYSLVTKIDSPIWICYP